MTYEEKAEQLLNSLPPEPEDSNCECDLPDDLVDIDYISFNGHYIWCEHYEDCNCNKDYTMVQKMLMGCKDGYGHLDSCKYYK